METVYYVIGASVLIVIIMITHSLCTHTSNSEGFYNYPYYHQLGEHLVMRKILYGLPEGSCPSENAYESI